ncbi:MAG TPA: hypothetical protein VNI83_02095 [Vicinamibacterales bacterium]|nr:hypothetical protein [Vicinamibacterales bacterium]
MPETVIHNVGSCQIDSKSYRLVRAGNRQAYVQGFEDEPPWVGGAPVMVSEPQFTFHLGGLKSRPGIPGTTEYGKNTDGRFPFRLLPSAKINTLTLPSSAHEPTSIFEALGYVFVVAGQRVYRIDPATDAVTLSKDFGGGTLGVMGLRWEQDFGLVTTDAASQSLWKVTAIGTPDTWTQSADVAAYRLAAGINRLFKVTKTGELRNVSTGLDPMTNANWADNVQVGETATLPTGLLAYERTVFVGKPEGLFGVGDDGFGMPLIKRMARDAGNCYGMTLFDPWVLVPHVRGLYRYVPGLAEACGLEREKLNESPVRGRWQGFAADGEWIYGLLAVGSDTYVMTGRERSEEGLGFGPLVWDTWLHFSGTSKAIWLSALSSPPRLWFGNGNNISYVKLSTGAGAPDVDGTGYEFALSGQRFSYKYRFDDWGPKDFIKIDVVGRNLTAARYWDVFYSVDGGAFSNLDASGAAMRVNSSGRRTFQLPTSAVGREVQFRFDYTGDSASSAGELNYWEVFAVPQSRKVPVVTAHLLLEEGIYHDEEVEQRSPSAQFNDLAALLEQATPVSTTGPWGEAVSAKVARLRIIETLQDGNTEPRFIVEVGLQLREA